MVYRIYVEKKRQEALEAKGLLYDIRTFLSISSLEDLRVLNRYDVENIEEPLFEACKNKVFYEPQVDIYYDDLPKGNDTIIAAEYLPGQFDQRADSCEQCIQLISKGDRPLVKTAKIYLLSGKLSEEDIQKIKKYLINPVESREASLEKPLTLKTDTEIPTEVAVLNGFINFTEEERKAFLEEYGLAMDLDDLSLCQNYFKEEKRDPSITEIRMIDTYWSDHCRHTTFTTELKSVEFADEKAQKSFERYLALRKELGVTKPITLMNLATIAPKYLKANGKLNALDESEEINACTIKIDVEVEGKTEKWLLLFKNETHNHPTEIEPFGGAATCIGGAIRDPLSGRGYVYQAMRITGGGDPTVSIDKTITGKLPQRKLLTTAAAGYSSYGNQIGLATGLVDEIYHEGYLAKHMEIGAVVGAVPAEQVVRECPVPGDIVVLLGGKTGRDGCGGATGSSKSHNVKSLDLCGAEVQKGNAPEERKLQRLFRNPTVSKMIKRCNDFGAGGVSVAIGELADGLLIDLDSVSKKYEGLDGTELAISESQERMAIVIDPNDVEQMLALAKEENVEATVVAKVTEEPRLTMLWNGKKIVDIKRAFLDTNGAPKQVDVAVTKPGKEERKQEEDSLEKQFFVLANDVNVASKRGLSERFDSTIGANTVLMPFGGKYQRTPIQAMAAKIPVLGKNTTTCSVMSYGYNPVIMKRDPYAGAFLAVVESVSKLIATGAPLEGCYLTFQEYFERLGKEKVRWGKPLAALLGALDAQLGLEIAAIGGKDSMSGSFEDLDVPPTLVSFAISVANVEQIISPEFKKAGSRIAWIAPKTDENGLPCIESLKEIFAAVTEGISKKEIISAYTPGFGGIAEGIMKMCFGNKIGAALIDIRKDTLFGYGYGGFLLETTENAKIGQTIGTTTEKQEITLAGESVCLEQLLCEYENRLEPVYPSNAEAKIEPVEKPDYIAKTRVLSKVKVARPNVLIPVFPGTNCEYDTQKAFEQAGAKANIFVVKNLCAADVQESADAFAKMIDSSQIVFLPGGFSGGDEPDGSGKFITAFLNNPLIREKIQDLLEHRDGLMGGICNGFQALIKLGLVPYGEIREATEESPTLTFNTIGRHQSRLVRVRVASNKSPWLMHTNVGDVYLAPISHGEGRFLCNQALLEELKKNGQIATQYCDLEGNPSMEIDANPNGSVFAVEGITSKDGRVFGRMAHSERTGAGLYKNVPGNLNNRIFEGAVDYFK